MPSPMRRLLALTAVLVAASSLLGASAQARPLHPALQSANLRIDWSNLTDAEHVRVLRRWKAAPSLLPELLHRVAGRLTIRRSSDNEAAGGNFTETQYDGSYETWRVTLSWPVLNWGSKLGAHLTLHELGHVIDGALVDDALRNDFLALFRLHPVWQECYPMPLGSSSRCVRAPEIFAEHFGFWAAGFRRVRTFYELPPLASRRDFGRLMASALSSRPSSSLPSRSAAR